MNVCMIVLLYAHKSKVFQEGYGLMFFGNITPYIILIYTNSVFHTISLLHLDKHVIHYELGGDMDVFLLAGITCLSSLCDITFG